MGAEALATLTGADIDSFEIHHFRSFSDDVSFELQLIVLGHDPNPALFDTASASFAKTIRIFFQGIYAALFKGELRVDRDYQIKISHGRHAQAANVFR